MHCTSRQNPLELKVTWAETKVEVFGGLLHETVQSGHAYEEVIEYLESCTYIGSVVSNGG